MTNTYEIRNITDILRIPANRIHDCLSEIADQFVQLSAILTASGVDLNNVEFDQEVITWVDDGKKNATATVRIDEEVLRVQVGQEPSND
ncbi:hypothetical protein G9F32_02920 [Acinetobacter sp. 194]|uniref:hypothetical protein n=1 Tax=Acinetobacter shaoyimingii TaxID=2715164 RepID=UPI0014088048|nr:hypothetical protein [Acinetobacter shaoyimingii]NHB56987.1 hypothetical protein [Acinetobacter shaoyimingii]